ncbi:MAG: hypothetical protein HFJ43_02345 [Clostridia bacterium]|nr:hypothetical protein [Clostridia bacterium]
MKKSEESIENKSKLNKKGVITNIIVILIAIAIMVVMFRTVIQLFMQPTELFVVEKGNLRLEETADAYIIRNEVVLKGENYKNGIEKVKTEGKKVAKKDTVFRYYVNGEDELKKRIEEIDNKILEVQDTEIINYSGEIKNIKNQIKDILEEMSKTNNIEDLKIYKKEISECNSKIVKIIGENTKKGSYLRDLINEKEKYEKKLEDNAEIIKAKESGIISYRVDGYEDILKPNKFKNLNKEFLEKLDLRTGELIEPSNEKGKIVTSFDTYLATVLNSDAARKAKVGDKIKIDIGNNTSVKAEIVSIKVENENERLIIFKIINLSEDILNYRKISVDIIWWSYSGLKVPKSALIKEGDYHYVIKKRAGYNSKILVKVLQSNDTYSLVDNYSSKELSEMGYNAEQIRNIYTIKMYDKIQTVGD